MRGAAPTLLARGLRASLLSLLALSSPAAAALAQSTAAPGPPGTGDLPAWTRSWSPLAPIADLGRQPPGRGVFPQLLTLPTPRVGLFWTAGNPAALPLEVGEARVEFRGGASGVSGDYARPLDPGGVSRGGASAFGWRPLGTRGAAVGRFIVELTTLEDSIFADVLEPYGSNPFIVMDTIGDPMRRTAVRAEGATGWRFGSLAVGLGFGFEPQETRTIESPVPRLDRSTNPGATGGMVYGRPDGAFAVGAYGRWRQVTQLTSITTIAQPSRIFEIQGYEEPVPLDLQPATYRRRFEGNAYALGASAGGRVAGLSWALWGQGEATEEDQGAGGNLEDPSRDTWDADGWAAGGALRWTAAGERLLVTLDGRYRTLEGEAFRGDVGGVVFTVDESRFDADVEVRYASPGGWLAAGRFGAIREVRRRRDRLAQAASDIRSWEAGGAAEVGRRFGDLALSAGGLLSAYGPSGTAPPPDEMGPVYRRFVGPELSLGLAEAREVAGQLTIRWDPSASTGLWIRGRAGELEPAAGAADFPLLPSGSRTRWSLTAGAVLGATWP